MADSYGSDADRNKQQFYIDSGYGVFFEQHDDEQPTAGSDGFDSDFGFVARSAIYGHHYDGEIVYRFVRFSEFRLPSQIVFNGFGTDT